MTQNTKYLEETPRRFPTPAPLVYGGGGANNSTLVEAVQEKWLQLSEYFIQVQCADTPEERHMLRGRLPDVENALNVVLDALLTERRTMAAHQVRFGGTLTNNTFSCTFTGASGNSPNPLDGLSPIPAYRDPQAGDSFVKRPPIDITTGAAVRGALPPCYTYLFVDAHHCAEAEKDNSELQPSADGAAPEILPIGSSFLMTLCQLAKQDEPPGMRDVIFRFLIRLLREADLPMNRTIGTQDCPPQSILQADPNVLVVPLLDLLRRVSSALDPSVASHGLRGRKMQENLPDTGRTQFVMLAITLAEKAEMIPDLANYFVVEEPDSLESTIASTTAAAAAAPEALSNKRFVLLEALLPYLTHDCGTAEWKSRRDTCRYALSAVVSLAKCPDRWIQDLVGRETRIATSTLIAARTTLLTLCKVPENDDSVTQVEFLRDVLRFWSTLINMAPAVARALNLRQLMERDFVHQTLLPLFQSPDSHVYSAVAIFTAQLVEDLQSACPIVTEAVAYALLGASVLKATGKVHVERDVYATMMATHPRQRDAAADDLHGDDAGFSTTLRMSDYTSMLFYYLLPRLSSNPVWDAEDRETSSMLGYVTTRWTAVKATLTLIRALARGCPLLLQKYGFFVDMYDMETVRHRRRHSLMAAARNGDAVSVNLSAAASAPQLDMQSCFAACLKSHTDISHGDAVSQKAGVEVLAELLYIETNTPVNAIQHRQRVVGSWDTKPEDAQSTGPDAAERDAAEDAGLPHCWFHRGAHASPLTLALANVTSHLITLPMTVSSLAVDCVVSVLLMPDYRVMYTLLDPQLGRIFQSLVRLKALVEKEFISEEEAAMTSAAATAKASHTPAKPAGRLPSGERGDTFYTRSFLYKLLTEQEELLLRGPSLSGNGEKGRVSAQSTPMKGTGSGESSEVNTAVREGVSKHCNFLYSCLFTEYLRIKLDALVGYASLSHNLINLKPDV